MTQMLQVNKNSNIKYDVIQVKLTKKTYQIELEDSIKNLYTLKVARNVWYADAVKDYYTSQHPS